MAENSKIEWTDHTFNPWIGCAKVHAGCAHCYAEADFDKRRHRAKWGPHGTRVPTSDANWREPLKWNRDAKADGVRAKVFCASLADVFEDFEGGQLDQYREALFTLIDSTPHLDWLLLTKRPENIRRMWPCYVTPPHRQYRENVWLGTSISDQESADKQIPALEECRDLAPVLFLSAEPLLGPIDLDFACDRRELSCIDWVICGGESGHDARPMHPAWVRSLRDQCDAADVRFFFKQWGEWLDWDLASLFDRGAKQVDAFIDCNPPVRVVRVGKKTAGRILDGRTWDEFPTLRAAIGGEV